MPGDDLELDLGVGSGDSGYGSVVSALQMGECPKQQKPAGEAQPRSTTLTGHPLTLPSPLGERERVRGGDARALGLRARSHAAFIVPQTALL